MQRVAIARSDKIRFKGAGVLHSPFVFAPCCANVAGGEEAQRASNVSAGKSGIQRDRAVEAHECRLDVSGVFQGIAEVQMEPWLVWFHRERTAKSLARLAVIALCMQREPEITVVVRLAPSAC